MIFSQGAFDCLHQQALEYNLSTRQVPELGVLTGANDSCQPPDTLTAVCRQRSEYTATMKCVCVYVSAGQSEQCVSNAWASTSGQQALSV